ncbi:uncharacterized protein LOC101174983 [Oryzias latipes]|uniref:uncharacterized protein LOC101174983 n=1 Tax=Oryzias latipes TaxID=8090 RepID=UPI000CE197DB|nr:uncharacterized protein LOC101174983 [Oryzias latipes]
MSGMNSSAAALPKDSFANAVTKNVMAVLVWLAISVINVSMVRTFLQHRAFYENPRYIMFICMVVNDALQLSLVTALYVVSYVFRKIPVLVCCPLVRPNAVRGGSVCVGGFSGLKGPDQGSAAWGSGTSCDSFTLHVVFVPHCSKVFIGEHQLNPVWHKKSFILKGSQSKKAFSHFEKKLVSVHTQAKKKNDSFFILNVKEVGSESGSESGGVRPKRLFHCWKSSGSLMRQSCWSSLRGVGGHGPRPQRVLVCSRQIMAAVFTTRSTPLILAGMAVERFVSICFPLHYSQTCTVRRTLLLISIILILTAAPPATDLLIGTLTEPPTFFQSAVFCDHSLLFRHASVYYKNCVFDGLYLSSVALTLLYTYCRIMLAARAASAGLASVNRARNTVLLHGVQVGVTGGRRSPVCSVSCLSLQSGFFQMLRPCHFMYFMYVLHGGRVMACTCTVLPSSKAPSASQSQSRSHAGAECQASTKGKAGTLQRGGRQGGNRTLRTRSTAIPLEPRGEVKVGAAGSDPVLSRLFQLMLCMLAFVVPSLQAALISLFPLLILEIRYIFFLLVYIIPRFLSPVIYGCRDQLFRKYWIQNVSCRRRGASRVLPALRRDAKPPFPRVCTHPL